MKLLKQCLALLLAAGAVPSPAARAQSCVSIDCPGDLTVECRGPATRVEFNIAATSQCSRDVTVVSLPGSGSLFPPGPTLVVCTATDGLGNSNTCQFTVTVRDRTGPEILCPDLIVQPCQSPAGAQVDFSVSVGDLCDTNVQVVCTPPSGSLFPPGTNLVTCLAWDSAGNESRCVFPVVVTGGCALDPCVSIVCPSRIVVNTVGAEGTPVTFSVDATNRCGESAIAVCEPPSGSLFPVGLSTVLCSVRGRSGIRAQCTFQVEVVDEIPPVVRCPTNLTVHAQGPDGAVVNWAVAASDNSDRNVTVRCEPPSGSLFPVGDTPVLCTAVDDSGNQSVCGFLVTVAPHRFEIVSETPPELLLRWAGHGMVETAILLEEPAVWRPVPGPINTNGNDRTLSYRPDAAQRYFRLVSAPLAPPRDDDGDGVPNGADRCPNTARSSVVDTCGCTALQLSSRPETVFALAHTQLRELAEMILPAGELAGLGGAVLSTLGDMELAAEEIRGGLFGDGRTPVGADRYREGIAKLRTTHVGLLDTIAILDAARAPLPWPPEYGDVGQDEITIVKYRSLANLLARGINAAEAAGRSLDWLKSSQVSRSSLRGQVMEINDAERWVKLGDGKKVGLVERYYPELIYPGSWLDLDVVNLTDGTALAQGVAVSPDGPTIPADVLKIRCMELRVAPVQDLSPGVTGPFLLHYPEAYTFTSASGEKAIYMEQGMGLAVVHGGCPWETWTGKSIRYYAKMDLTFPNSKKTTLTTSLRPDQLPVSLNGVLPGGKVKLTVTVFRRECPYVTGELGCSAPEVVSVDDYIVYLMARFSYARAQYSATLFDLEDYPKNPNFRTVQVTNVEVLAKALQGALDVSITKQFQGLGYSVINKKSSYPDVNEIHGESPFAIHVRDIYDLEKEEGNVFAMDDYGITKPAGLIWPFLKGFHNGRPFAYACELPSLVRDAVSFCSGTSNTFYRLPFAYQHGWPLWTVTQGNNGSFSHKGVFAYDFATFEGNPIHAARGGVVVGVLESATKHDPNMSSCKMDGNHVIIRHQDGTLGIYYHMIKNGVLVDLKHLVRRGDSIAKVGNTGCSTGPHLHFQVDSSFTGLSVQSRFEAFDSHWNDDFKWFEPSSTKKECYVPDKGDVLFSTNE